MSMPFQEKRSLSLLLGVGLLEGMYQSMSEKDHVLGFKPTPVQKALMTLIGSSSLRFDPGGPPVSPLESDASEVHGGFCWIELSKKLGAKEYNTAPSYISVVGSPLLLQSIYVRSHCTSCPGHPSMCSLLCHLGWTSLWAGSVFHSRFCLPLRLVQSLIPWHLLQVGTRQIGLDWAVWEGRKPHGASGHPFTQKTPGQKGLLC